MRTSKQIVVHVFGRMDRGGAELRTIDLMRQRHFADSFECHFITLAPGSGTLDHEIESLGGHIHSCPLRRKGFNRKFRQLLRDVGCQILHAHVHHFSGYLLRLGAQERVPARIAHFRSTGDGKELSIGRRIQQWIMKYWIHKYATSIIAVSEGAMGAAWRSDWIKDHRCGVIYNGVDLSRFQEPADRCGVRREFGLPADCKLVVHIGSMTEPKNHTRLIDIFSMLHRLNPTCRLLLVGRDSTGARARLERHVRALKVAASVRFAGEREDIARLLGAADVMIFPSLREGLPGAVLEACAAGVPVVASPLPGIREIGTFCSSVSCVSLQATDAEWAAVVNAALAGGGNRVDLVGGPFDLTVAGAAMTRLYTGGHRSLKVETALPL